MTNTTAFEAARALRLPSNLGLRTPYPAAKVLGFHKLYNVPMGPDRCKDPEFKHMDNPRVGLRLGLIVEEFKELLKDGFGIDANITFCRADDNPDDGDWRTDDITKAMEVIDPKRNGVEVADALGDLVYVIYGFALEMGYDLDDVIDEIHASNLTKLGEDGKPIYREDGKVLKGPNYIKPNIRAALGMES